MLSSETETDLLEHPVRAPNVVHENSTAASAALINLLFFIYISSKRPDFNSDTDKKHIKGNIRILPTQLLHLKKNKFKL